MIDTSRNRSFRAPRRLGSSELALHGHSTFRVEIRQVAGEVVVEKSAVDPADNERLARQIAKQRDARERNSLAFVRVPSVLSEGVVDDRFRATMEYVYFHDCLRYFGAAPLDGVRAVADMLLDYVDSEVACSEMVELPTGPLHHKLDDVDRALRVGGGTSEVYRGYVDRLRRLIDARGGIRIPVGSCHGDLTFSNVMIASDSSAIALIDFLDSFLDSPLVDLAKLRQDTRFYWTLLMTDGPTDAVRYVQVMQYIDRQIMLRYGAEPWFADNVDMVLGLNLLRIAPYARAPSIHAFIVDSLEALRI